MLVSSSRRSPNLILIFLVLLLALGLWLRWRFIQTVHLYPDEFVTLLAVRMIGEKGWPIMPSGLFYDHGLLFSYIGSVASIFGPMRLTVRYASLLFGGLTLVLIFRVGRRWFSPAVGLMATAALAIAPTAIHWGGRARMYALLQLLVLVTLWLAYEGITQNRAYLRWLALFAYLGATLTHFAAVTLAPPLVLAALVLWLESRAGEQGSRGVEERSAVLRWIKWRREWLELIALAGVLIIAFLVKRAGQPKGIEALDGSGGQAVTGLVEVFNIYSDFSFNLVDGWQAIAPFYLTLPALILTPFALITIFGSVRTFGGVLAGHQSSTPAEASTPAPSLPHTPALFLSIILIVTTLEMMLLVSPDRRDDKYQFMLLPILLLLGAQGINLIGRWLLTLSRMVSKSNSKLAITNYQLPITILSPLLISFFIIALTWSDAQALLANTGDDYDSAFAYVQEHWQAGDTILTGTPSAAAFYLGRNDFYGVQRQGGYDYRLLNINDQPVDRWLASPAIRTEADLHQILANHSVWLVLERWGLQREYYDLPFQQQLLAQTDYVTEAQGIFILHSKPDAQPIRLTPTHTMEAVFGDMVELTGYTVEPEQVAPGQSLRLTLYWQALAAMPDDYTVFVHLRLPDGGAVAQADHRPLGNLYPTTLWPTGEIIRESSELPLSPDLAPGDYNLWVGLYLLETGDRLIVKDDAGGENAVKLGGVSVGN